MIAGLMELLRGGSDSGGQAAARAIKNLSAGHASSAKVGRRLPCWTVAGIVLQALEWLPSAACRLRVHGARFVWFQSHLPRSFKCSVIYANAQQVLTARALPYPPPRQVRFATAGAIPLLVKLLRAPKDATRRAAASGGVRLLRSRPAGRPAVAAPVCLVPVAGLRHLLQRSRRATPSCLLTFPSCHPAHAALWNLAYHNNANRKSIVLAGAIPPLVRLLTVGLIATASFSSIPPPCV